MCDTSKRTYKSLKQVINHIQCLIQSRRCLFRHSNDRPLEVCNASELTSNQKPSFRQSGCIVLVITTELPQLHIGHRATKPVCQHIYDEDGCLEYRSGLDGDREPSLAENTQVSWTLHDLLLEPIETQFL